MTDVPLDEKKSVPVAVLDQTHEEYAQKIIEIVLRDLLYHGGRDILAPDNVEKFVPKVSVYEHPESYRQKLACATYTNNYCKPINFFASQLMNKKIAVLPRGKPLPNFYQQFAMDADWRGTAYRDFLKQSVTELLNHGETIVSCDLPGNPTGEAIEVQAQEEGKDRAYLIRIPAEALIDWEEDDHGKFNWVRLRKQFRRSNGPLAPRGKYVTQWKVIYREEKAIKWQMFEVEHDTPTIPTGEVARHVNGGTLSFTEFPVVRFKMPDGLWLGRKIQTKCADHFRLQTALHYSQMRTLFAVPVYKMGVQPSGVSGTTQFDVNSERDQEASAKMASKGMLVIGPWDELEYFEPSGQSYEQLNTQLKEMQDDIMRIADQMAQTISATIHGSARSAASKLQDNHATEVILEELGSIAHDMSIVIYDLVANGRKESFEWEASGLSDYKMVEQLERVEEALHVPAVVSAFPSRTLRTKYSQQVGISLLKNPTPQDEEDIRKELEEAYKNGAGPAMSHEDELDGKGEDEASPGTEEPGKEE